jgi:methyl-accepting chemotaxis protein
MRIAMIDNVRLKTMVDEMPINVIMADPVDFTINYINKTSLNTLKPLEHLLPCKAADLKGQCIDIFHKNPEHQRRLLADPVNLPHQAKIKLGDETLDLRVSAIRDGKGAYLGPMVSWAVVTQQVKMADDFETNVKSVVDSVSAAATEMQATAQSMSSTAEETNRQSTAVAAASEEATTNVQTVASAAEELSASVSEISN